MKTGIAVKKSKKIQFFQLVYNLRQDTDPDPYRHQNNADSQRWYALVYANESWMVGGCWNGNATEYM
jgi:hypothetical protein